MTGAGPAVAATILRSIRQAGTETIHEVGTNASIVSCRNHTPERCDTTRPAGPFCVPGQEHLLVSDPAWE